jgi:hypothetical protein
MVTYNFKKEETLYKVPESCVTGYQFHIVQKKSTSHVQLLRARTSFAGWRVYDSYLGIMSN